VVGLAAAHAAQLLGASIVMVGDLIPERLEQARSFGCEPIDVSKGDPKEQIANVLGEALAVAVNPPTGLPEVDAGVDAVGFEARGQRRARRRGDAGDRSELADGHHARRRRPRHPGPLRDR
jgi:threonine dehydrogenase-like Zn-dependent dehydrogenase